MRHHVTIIPSIGLIVVEGRPIELTFEAPANIHAVQWSGQQGHIEFNDGRSNKPLTIDDYDLHVSRFVALWEAEAALLDACPGPAYDLDRVGRQWVYNIEKDSPGPEYRLLDGAWVRIIFSKKDFLLKCGLPQVIKLNTVIADNNPLAKTVHDFLLASEYIDLTDPATAQLVAVLTTEEAGSVLTGDEAAQILQGVPYVAPV